MDNWDVIARSLEQGREDRKWYENEARTAAALRLAYSAGRADARAQYAPLTWIDSAGVFLSQSIVPMPQGDGHP